MKKHLLIIISLFIFNEAVAQQESTNTVKWLISASKMAEIGDTIQINITGKITDDWYIYASNTDSTEYVTPAFLMLEKNASYDLLPPLESVNSSKYHDEALDQDEMIFRDTAIMIQRIIIKRKQVDLKGVLKYMIVRKDDKSGTVRNDSQHFKLNIN